MRGRFARFRRRPTTGLVLSGAGSKASFQLGALRYLYDVVGITPTVITGSSAGSVLAAVLAQYADHEGQSRARDAVEKVWLSMRTTSDIFTEQEWYESLRAAGPTWMKALQQRPDHSLRRSGFILRRRKQGTAEGESESEEAATAWSPLTVLEWVGLLRDLNRTSSSLEEIVRGANSERAVYRLGPIVERLLDPEVLAAQRVATSGVQLRVAVAGLESGELHYVTETGTLVDRSNRPLPGRASVDLVAALHASCAIPGVFAPVELGGEHYVDGGVRESLPAQLAIEHLGVNNCYAVVATAPGPGREESYAERGMFSILLRSTSGMMSAEIERKEVAWAQAAGATVIQPELDVHDGMTVDPGLLTIAADYGYMRAAEVHTRASDSASSRDITRLRKEIWQLENDAREQDEVSGTATDLRERRAELRRLAHATPQDLLPPVAARWGTRPERHGWDNEGSGARTRGAHRG